MLEQQCDKCGKKILRGQPMNTCSACVKTFCNACYSSICKSCGRGKVIRGKLGG